MNGQVRKLGLVLGLWVAAWPLGAQAAVIFVKPGGDDGQDGLSWATAKKTVKAGLKAAAAGDDVWVAAGTYVERITLKLDVELYGGFAGDEDPATFDLADRDFVVNETILDGNQAGTVVTGPPSATDTCRIDGFTITGAGAYSGGGVYLEKSSPTVTNNTIAGNHAYESGGGLYLSSSNSIITNNRITGNRTDTRGGSALYVSQSAPTIANNTIVGNRGGDRGGALYLYQCSPMITNNTIVGNSAWDGGGLYAFRSFAVIRNNMIACNGAASRGGGIYLQESSPTFANNTLTANSASAGGALYLDSSDLTIANTIMALNSSGIYRSRGTATLRHNCVYANTEYNFLIIRLTPVRKYGIC